ncbi:DNA topoisomerase III [Bacillaceae bacterium SIJ1]|uniref:DNA topoisomerase III n=1 Tax=Litoribacterium kuwaitense TaxID=1398745 RepID=UPI0013EA5B86|nr:DNA topoisomerase III [Litoribacterium kuwaitense]NGP45433.1 DNA topoisomerase III [Litoribacterium kuwaitense]
MKSLILAEKPSVAKEIARVLGCQQKNKNYIEGSNYVVTWALGHLVELKTPEDYDKRYQTWRMDDLPIMPKEMKKKIIPGSKAQFFAIKKLAERKDLKELIIATDAGREGELVARWIMEMVHWKKPFKRLWISSQTDQAIKQGFKQLKNGRDFDRLYQSAVCRSEADWLVGLNISRALTTKYDEPLSAGRVQTPTLASVYERDKAIQAFKPKEYWTVSATIGQVDAQWDSEKGPRLFDKAQAEAIQTEVTNQEGKVISVRKKTVSDQPPLPYDLTELQRDANQRFNYSAKKTLNVLQTLYERYKVVTYPRTDSKYLSSDLVPTLAGKLKAIEGHYKDEVRPVRAKPNVSKRAVNDSKVTDHHAIIVTEERANLAAMQQDERNIYDLVARRFIALFHGPAKAETVKATLKVGKHTFQASGRKEIDAGYKQVFGKGNDEEENPAVAKLSEGQTLAVTHVRLKSCLTEAPKKFSEADLLATMDKYGLGTPATRADIIEKLIKSDSMELTNHRLTVTKKGKQLLDLVDDELTSPELTASWEKELEAIARGKGNATAFMANIREKTKTLVTNVRNSDKTYVAHNLTGSKCPECGSLLKERNGRNGKMLVCSSRECSYRRQKDPMLSNRRCPQCKKKMEMHNGKAGRYFQCKRCNVVEKAEDKKKKVNKREEKKLLNQYKKEEPLGNSLADALKQAMKDKE